MSDFSPLDDDNAEQYHDELRSILEERAEVAYLNHNHSLSPFDATYEALADVILAATNVYIGLRAIEDTLSGEGGD